MKKLRWVLIGAVAGTLLSGCGSSDDAQTTVKLPLELTRELDICLDGGAGPATIGILMADLRGYFLDAGLSVWVRSPASRVRPVPYLVEGEDDLAVTHQPQVVMAKDKGAPITTFGSLVSEPTAAMIWLGKSGFEDVSDLEGKSIGISGLPSERALLENVLQREGLAPEDVEITLSDYDMVPDLVSGRVDAILGAANVEGAELEARGLNPVVTPLSDFGVPSYEEFVLIIRSDRLAKDPNMVRAFMTAVARGTAAAIEDPKAAASVMERSVGADPDRSREVNEALIEATLPLLSRDGAMDPDQAEGLAGWMEEEGMVEEAPSADELLTNDYLPPAS